MDSGTDVSKLVPNGEDGMKWDPPAQSCIMMSCQIGVLAGAAPMTVVVTRVTAANRSANFI